MRVTFNGVIDGGQILPLDQVPDEYLDECNLNAATCFISLPDGQVDTGFYYVQGGTFSYDAFTMQIGIRYTF